MLNQIVEKFSTEVVPVSSPSDDVEQCDRCNSAEWWLPKNQSRWRCVHCEPPISEALVDNRRGSSIIEEEQPSDEPSELILTACRPWCERCGCWRGIELTWPDGRSETRCWTCKATMPVRPRLGPSLSKKHANRSFAARVKQKQ